MLHLNGAVRPRQKFCGQPTGALEGRLTDWSLNPGLCNCALASPDPIRRVPSTTLLGSVTAQAAQLKGYARTMSASDDDRGGDGGGFDLDAAPLWVDEPSSSTTKGAPATKKDAKAASKAEKDREAEEARKRSSKACASPSLRSVGRTAAPQRLTSLYVRLPRYSGVLRDTGDKYVLYNLFRLLARVPAPSLGLANRHMTRAAERRAAAPPSSDDLSWLTFVLCPALSLRAIKPLRSRYASAAARANANALGFSTRHRRLPSGHARTA